MTKIIGIQIFIMFWFFRVHHSTQLIIKLVQPTKSNGVAHKEIDKAVNRVEEAQQLMPVALPREDMPDI